ncbi:hypothetical protein ACQKWADRAFT_176616 [Trichoderma austrokoningii]
MASNPFEAAQFDAGIFNLYHDNAAVVRTAVSVPQLPGGGCNYVDLTPGAHASRCGCRRFWSSQPGSPLVDQASWCMCSHHACYHDEQPRNSQPPQQSAEMITMPSTAQITENLQALRGRDTMSPAVDLIAAKEASAMLESELLSFNGASPLSFLQKPIDEHFNSLGQVSTPRQASDSMPDTLPWADTVRRTQSESPAAQSFLPQSFMSQATSSNSTIHAKYLRPFAGKGMHTLSRYNPSAVPLQSIEQPDSPLQQTATRSIEEPFAAFTPADEESTPRPDTATTQIEPRAVTAAAASEALQNLADMVDAHSERLDNLETVSFSDNGHEECSDNYELLDLRVVELESKMDDIEKRVFDNDSTDDLSDEDASTISSAANRPNFSQEVYGQLQSLQAQVDQLQTVIPSWNHAWEVEVVFMPFPLGWLWQPIHQFKADVRNGNEDDLTQLPMTLSTSRSRAQSPFLEDWPAHNRGADWLLPRACGAKGVADWRLRSRGLVKKIVVKDPDAKSVSLAMHAAFGHVFRDMHLYARPQSSQSQASKYMGLRSPWVPLRKIHRDSRLRFLGPEEMLTPALWDVQFLNSIMMRSSEPRLFVTHPDAYLQAHQACESSWTWAKLKEMPAVHDITESQEADITESQETADVNRLEGCWGWNEQLDRPPASRASSETPRQSILVTPDKESVPPFPRTPSTAPILATSDQNASGASLKWPRSSRGQSRRSSSILQSLPQAGVTKKRPARDVSGYARYTPSLTESPPPINIARQRSRSETPNRIMAVARDMTPSDYATPHSTAPLQEPERRYLREQSVAMHDADDLDNPSDGDEPSTSEGGDESEQEEEEMENISNSTMIASTGFRLPVSSSQPVSSNPWSDMQDEGSHNHPNMENIAPRAIGRLINDGHHFDGENIDPDRMVVDRESGLSGLSAYLRWQRTTLGGVHIHRNK